MLYKHGRLDIVTGCCRCSTAITRRFTVSTAALPHTQKMQSETPKSTKSQRRRPSLPEWLSEWQYEWWWMGAHGMYRIYRAGPKRRAMWLAYLLTLWGFMFYQLSQVFDSFSSYPVSTSMQIVDDGKPPFPSIVICNANIVRRSKLEAHARRTRTEREWDEFLAENYTYPDGRGTAQRLMRKKIRRLFFKNRFMYSDFGHDIRDILVSCRVDQVACDLSDFIYFPSASYGILQL